MRPDEEPMNLLLENVDDQAAAWFAHMTSDVKTSQDDERFWAWLRANPAHEEAYEKLQSTWAELGELSANADILRMREAALNRKVESGFAERFFSAKFRLVASLAAVLVMTVIGAYVLTALMPGNVYYETTLGERSTFILADGSSVTLNTQSRMNVDFTNSRRHIELLSGQAHFDVQKDSQRPFIVNAAGGIVTAVGTAFDVYVRNEDVVVTLLEGKVSVEQTGSITNGEDPAQLSRSLEIGQQVSYSKSGLSEIASVNTEKTTAWRSGRLIFDDDPLSEALAEVNRYSETQIYVEDEMLNDLRVSGVFKAGRTDRVAKALETYFPIEVITDADGHVILRSRGS